MRQVIQSFRTGELSLVDVPVPMARSRGIIVRTMASVISAGTERMVLQFAEKNLIEKAQARPDLVGQVVEKIGRDGFMSAIDGIRNKLDQPLPLGYSSSGIVVEVGSDAGGFQLGDRVACAGGGYASHAEFEFIPRNLAVLLPDGVTFEVGAFGAIGAIALHGVRQAEVQVGSTIAVVGLGLIGQLTVQILKASGCRTMGIDPDPLRVHQAKEAGADVAVANLEALNAGKHFTRGRGFDAVLITADTKSNEPVQLAGEISRDRGTVVAVGAVGFEIPRKLYYEKEIQFRIGRSYGPGRYDVEYEERGNDYPYGYVRWTEQRNVEAFVQMCQSGALAVEQLITHRFPIADAKKAYAFLSGESKEQYTGIVLLYPDLARMERTVRLNATDLIRQRQDVRLGVLGAGVYASATLMPVIKKTGGAELTVVASGTGLTARSLADRFGFGKCASDPTSVIADPEVNTVAILTRHNLHADQVISSLRSGKNVFVEKPLCLTEEELDSIISEFALSQTVAAREKRAGPALLVGYNRRFAPFVVALRKRLTSVPEPLLINYRVNAGYLPASHWTQDLQQGGGRLIGEGCHFLDLFLYLTGDKPISVSSTALPNGNRYSQDNFIVTVKFAGGSVASLTYAANGSRAAGKEFLEVFGGGISARIDDFRTLHIIGEGENFSKKARLRTDKGHAAEWRAFVNHLSNDGPPPIAFEDLVSSTRLALKAVESMKAGAPMEISL